MFWTFAAILTFVAVAVVIYPLTRKSRRLQSAEAYDLTVYKSQLKEIDGDVERDLIASDEADAARAEVARRLLIAQEALEKQDREKAKQKSGKKSVAEKGAAPSTTARIIAISTVMIVPFISLGLYVVLGSPGLQSQPLAARLQKPPSQQSLTELVASAEKKLKQNPDDLQGWKKLAPIYLSMRRPNEAIKAYQNVLRLEGETSETLTDLGEAIVVREAGIVPDQAFGLFQRANELDARAPQAPLLPRNWPWPKGAGEKGHRGLGCLDQRFEADCTVGVICQEPDCGPCKSVSTTRLRIRQHNPMDQPPRTLQLCLGPVCRRCQGSLRDECWRPSADD